MVFCGEKAPGPWWAGPQALGARAPSPLETWPTGPWGLDPATLTDFLQAKFDFLLRLKPIGSGSQNATITPNPLTLGGVGWFPKAELYSSMRGGVPVFAPAFQPLHRAPSPGDLANKPALHPGQEFQKCPGAHRLMKSLACCTD